MKGQKKESEHKRKQRLRKKYEKEIRQVKKINGRRLKMAGS